MPTAFIWGASGGIGRALVERLVADGWTVGAASRHPDDLAGLTEHRFEADVTDAFAVSQAVLAAAQELPSVELWVYAAGDIMATPVAEMASPAWERILGANLTGAYLTAQQSLPLLAERAHLFLLGAYSERLQVPGLSAYAAAKAGLDAFAATLAKEQRKHRVTVVRPGAVNTPLWEKVPLRLPRTAMAPAELAQRILDAYHAGVTGTLDL